MATILVVDDEPSIRKLIYEILTRKGHRVFVAADAEEAVYLATTEKPEVSIVDLVMPGTGGMTLIMDSFRRMPEMGVIAMSGRIPMGADAFSSFSEQFGVSCFLGKPFSVDQITEAVGKALAKACSSG
jgi:two-component system response regulator (stage 0 sporulation protein F)